jgi:hypothetical protein
MANICVGHRHFEVDRASPLAHSFEIMVADMAAILAKMDGDAVGAGRLSDRSRRRIG